MLLDFKQLVKKYNLKFNKVIAVGAHWGQEYEDYVLCGAGEIIFVEPCQKAFEVLEQKFGNNPIVKLLNYACGSPDDPLEMEMFTGDETINKGMSNSLLKPAKHLKLHPEVEFPNKEMVLVSTLDAILCGDYDCDLLVLDVQGYEGKVLKGATKVLKNVKYVYTEVNKDEVYEGCTRVEELDGILWEFDRVETGRWVGNSWTDALYIRRGLI